MRRDLPIALEADEVVEPDRVEAPQVAAQAFDPPAVAGLPQPAPIVERVAPTLAVGAEVVGRHAGHAATLTLLVEQEQLLVLPDVGAVVSHEHRDVADQQHAEMTRMTAQPLPLAIEHQLNELVVRDLFGQAAASRGERMRLAATKLGRPVEPRAAVLLGLERREQRVVGQPEVLALAELFEAVARDPGPETLESEAQPRHAKALGGAVASSFTVTKARRRRELPGLEQLVFDQVTKADELGAARERRRAVVRRVTAAGRHDRQHLPQTLPGAGQEPQELVRFGAEVAVTM